MNRQSDWNSWEPDNDVQQHQPPTRQQYSKTFNNRTGKNSGDLLIDIEARLAGIIIGKGGVKIKSIKRESGAFISIIDGDKCELKTVKISGNAKAKELAKKLINDIIGENKPVEIPEVVQAEGSDLFGSAIKTYNWEEFQKEQAENLQKRLAALAPIIKDFYKEHPEVSMMTDQEAKDFRLSKNNMMVKYVNDNKLKSIPKPVLKFSHAFQDYPEILEEIEKQKFEIPTPVQSQIWPIIMSGHDLIAIAQTGTGKTLAFLFPAFIHIDFQRTPRSERKGPSILVLAPTRELVLKIESEIQKYSFKGIKSMSIYGGANSRKENDCLQNGVEIVIATPGRLNDIVSRGAIDLSDVTFLILDKVDRLLALGFEPYIRASLIKVRPDRQTIMTSATWPLGVQRLSKSYTNNPIQVMVGSLDTKTVNIVKQDVLIMEEDEKERWLEHFLKNSSEDDKIIIFANRKVNVEHLSLELCRKGYAVESIHGGCEQSDREMALERLRNGEASILIATDVDSRGIDINDVTVVISYDFTKDFAEYMHRVGWTERASKTGLAILLMTRRDWGKAKELVEVMEKSGQDVPPQLQDMAKRFEAKNMRERAEGSERPFGDRRGGGGRMFSRGNGGNRRNYW